MTANVKKVLSKLAWMREQSIWPNGARYLWTDAFGVVLLVSLYHELKQKKFLDEAQQVVADVERVLGRRRGFRIGQAEDRDGQYFHYLAMWVFALCRLGRVIPEYRAKAIQLVKDIHPAFVIPGQGVHWKMLEDLSAPYPGFGLGALDAFHGYVVYRLLDEDALADEIRQMKTIVERSYRDLVITQDLGLGMMLWMTSFFPEERWARVHQERSLAMLDRMWIDPPCYFCRELGVPSVKFAFTNYGVSLGLQAVGASPKRSARLNSFFDVSFRRRIRHRCDYARHGMRVIFPRRVPTPRVQTWLPMTPAASAAAHYLGISRVFLINGILAMLIQAFIYRKWVEASAVVKGQTLYDPLKAPGLKLEERQIGTAGTIKRKVSQIRPGER